MRSPFDWKFAITLIVTIAGVVVPVWIWFFDLQAKSIQLSLLSQTPLVPVEASLGKGVTVSFNGAELDNPYVSVVRLINAGTKPVLSSEFESTIELSTGKNSKIVSAQVTQSEPKDLIGSLQFSATAVELKPLLLNPKDSLTIAVVTSGAQPVVTTRARIAGISSIPLIDESNQPQGKWQGRLILALGFLLLVVSAISYDGVSKRFGLTIRRRSAVLTTFTAGVAGIISIFTYFKLIGIAGELTAIAYVMVMSIGAYIVGALCNRRRDFEGVK